MNLVDRLKNKKVNITKEFYLGKKLRTKWEQHFANHLNDQEKESIHLKGDGGYLWHLFSYKKRNCLEREEAIEEFNKVHKENCFVFYQHQEKAFILEQSSALTFDDLKNEVDIYVLDENFRWTFVKTHETEWCGPYFCRA